jgi:hypothetical protein
MKCIECQTDNTLQDRTTNYGRCKQCQHPFVFEPTAMETVKITDGLFAKAIADISANDTLYFTPKQLGYLLDKRLQNKKVSGPLAVLIICGFLTLFTFITVVLPNLEYGSTIPFLLPGGINLIFLFLLLFLSTNQRASLRSRRLAARCLIIQGIAIFIVGVIAGLASNLFPVFAYAVVVGLAGLYLGQRSAKTQQNTAQKPLVEMSQVEDWLSSWQRINPIAKLLPPPNENALPATVNPDVTAYSFDRVVVTDTAAIAQLLIANNFHFENNSAILSITGYPQSIFQTTMEMLRRNPDLKVYAFHDCSSRGLNLVHQLRTSPQWFADSAIEIFDVGLVPRQVVKLPQVVIQQSPQFARTAQQLASTVRQQLTPEELAWLDAGNVVLLETFPPQRLIQALNRGIAGSRNLLQGDTGNTDSGLIWMGDSGSSYYGVESFG